MPESENGPFALMRTATTRTRFVPVGDRMFGLATMAGGLGELPLQFPTFVNAPEIATCACAVPGSAASAIASAVDPRSAAAPRGDPPRRAPRPLLEPLESANDAGTMLPPRSPWLRTETMTVRHLCKGYAPPSRARLTETHSGATWMTAVSVHLGARLKGCDSDSLVGGHPLRDFTQ